MTSNGSNRIPAWWRNVPIPDAYVIAIILAVLLHVFLPQQLLGVPWLGQLIGWPLIATGFLLAWRCVVAARTVDVEDPGELVTTGPYAHSRNPMYLAWTLLTLGLAFVVNTLWIVLLELGAMLFTAVYVIPLEEKQLTHRFGTVYKRYQAQVRRYL